MTTTEIKTALISVSDKTGIVEFARQLHENGVAVFSTGGTAAALKQHDIPVNDVSDYTGSPEIMGGRVKTLHPKIYAGILRRPGQDDELLTSENITAIDLVVVNLYPFESTITKADCTVADAIENIDIGGPTMIRAAAKNQAAVTVVVDPNDYALIVDELKTTDAITQNTRARLAHKAFTHTAHYDIAISNYFSNQYQPGALPKDLFMHYVKDTDLRYGENPHQRAAFYHSSNGQKENLQQLQGKALSYNNIADSEAAMDCVRQFQNDNACVIVKHANPCGVAIAENALSAYERANATDPTSSFGGIIAFNNKLDANTAQAIIDKQFVEVIIAPEIDDTVIEVLAKKPNVRLLLSDSLVTPSKNTLHFTPSTHGLLVQDRDNGLIVDTELTVATKRGPTDSEMRDLMFAWSVAKQVKSNAIVYAKDLATVGIGAGQMSRVISAKIATMQAKEHGFTIEGAVMASDAFFPFRDSIDEAAKAGISAIIQPGGSIRDEEVIQAANEADIAMVLTGMRHFKH